MCLKNLESLKNYGFFACTRFSMTKVEIEPISDADLYLFFVEGMRNPVSYISKRYSKANNKYLKSYGPKQESKHIIYLNANNLES